MKKKKTTNITKRRLPGQFYTITFKIVSYVFVLMIITLTIALSLMAVLYYSGFFAEGSPEGKPPVSPILLVIILILVSAIIGCVLSVALYSLSFKELTQFQVAMNKVAKGDFTVTLPDSEESYMHDLNTSFNAMVRSLKSIETLKTDFISDFSHEFKTPIASICGFAKLLKNPNVTEEDKQEYINIIITESNRLTQLSKNTLSMSKLDNLDGAIEKKDYPLVEQLRKCVLMFMTEAECKKIDLSLAGEENITYYGNEELMQQMWINIIGNAVKFTPEGGKIKVEASGSGDKITVRVSDNGVGMDADTKKHIFDKFYQGDPSRSVAGNGLGLSIVSKILQIAGGGIGVESELGKGTDFTVTLPIVRETEKPEKEKKERQGKKNGSDRA